MILFLVVKTYVEIVPINATVEQNINFGNCCIDARNAHTFIIEFAVSKLDVFFSRAILAAENKRWDEHCILPTTAVSSTLPVMPQALFLL